MWMVTVVALPAAHITQLHLEKVMEAVWVSRHIQVGAHRWAGREGGSWEIVVCQELPKPQSGWFCSHGHIWNHSMYK